MKKIRRNATKKLAAYADRVVSVTSSNLGNCFKGDEVLDGVISQHGSVAAFFKKNLTDDVMKHTFMTVNEEDNHLCLHIHSNQWYDISLKG